ncbi:DUF4783 domain-containing protein [Belliella aquatica]|uniref:DUF4783 domain-containing protein n=1 Tax=Belliella aquatica TaxID=1323734 RepID=A0ABQ1LT69_9BACT|nr:DUF4783 domain-containing protein [Belliella aquatica]MCH7404449.1 DUF4783 domain-containing protein [Belliella aquatica]GGC28166.1 hypothetical protein GCM10010993_03990 [Belliella aquatica]
MNKIVPILISFFVLLSLSLFTFASTEVENEVIFVSFKNGSSKDLARHFENGVELNINGSQGEFSKNQAELVLRDFFKKYPPEDFEILHEGYSGEQIKHYIGTYTSMGEAYRILIKGKIYQEVYKIYSLEIIRY